MRSVHRTIALLLAPLCLMACAAQQAPDAQDVAAETAAETATQTAVPAVGSAATPDALQARAAAAMQDFGGRLRGELRAAMEAGGPIAAVDVCHARAPAIAGEVMAAHGVRLGRVAVPDRHRNPGNVAEGWQGEALARFQAAVDAGGAPEDQAFLQYEGLPEGVALRMARGLRVEPGCLACHGNDIAPDLAARLRERYPQDLATGFQAGDLRGAIWVEVPAPGHAP